MASNVVTFSWDASATGYPDQDLHSFHESHSRWSDLHEDDDGVLYCLDAAHIDAALRLFQLDEIDRSSEHAFATLCNRHHAIGICNDQFIKYSLLRPPIPWPKNHDLKEFLQAGWTPSDIACVRSLSDPTAKVNRRLQAAAGRLISMPTFIAAKARLRKLWRKLPRHIRPGLPIARSVKLAAPGGLALEPAPDSLIEFSAEFDQFCNEWHLLGMTTWLLPDVRGPQWVPGLAQDEALRRGDLTVTTPWHFPVLAEDGLGRVLEAEHRRQAAERGVDDHESWETYARLLDVYHWENVLLERYGRVQRVKRFVTEMESVIAEVLGLSRDRVQLLRKRLRALQAGKLKSLRGQR